MSRADMTRINVSPRRSVKEICSRLVLSVWPSAWNRTSAPLCRSSSRTSSGSLKNASSASAWLTPCLSTLLRALPTSHSKPAARDQSIIAVYYSDIQRKTTSPGSLDPAGGRLLKAAAASIWNANFPPAAPCREPKWRSVRHRPQPNSVLDFSEFERKLEASRTRRSMSIPRTKPVIFISYAHLDEPENPRQDEVQWLSFVTGFLKPVETRGAVEVWTDRLMLGGADWGPEIERKLRGCDIFILLISHNSLSSHYVVDKEIAIIRARQANGEDVHFYPLLLTPTPDIDLDIVSDKNRRPRDGKSFFDYPLSDFFFFKQKTAYEIVKIAGEIAARKSAPTSSPPSAPTPS